CGLFLQPTSPAASKADTVGAPPPPPCDVTYTLPPVTTGVPLITLPASPIHAGWHCRGLKPQYASGPLAEYTMTRPYDWPTHTKPLATTGDWKTNPPPMPAIRRRGPRARPLVTPEVWLRPG